MPKRIVRLMPNSRQVTWGLSLIDGRICAVIGEGEQDVIRVELTEWLDSGETVASSALSDQSGVTLTKSNNSTSVDLTVSGVTGTGEADLTVTTSTGRKRVLRLGFRVPEAVPAGDDYYWQR